MLINAGMAALGARAAGQELTHHRRPIGSGTTWTDHLTGDVSAVESLASLAELPTQGAPCATLLRKFFERFGLVLNADSMSELLDVHGATRWEHHDAVRPAAAALTQAGFEIGLRHASGTVVFMAGGNGAGKSTFASGLPDETLVLDSTLSNDELSRQNVARALAAGRGVLLSFVYRDPVDAFINGVLVRFLDSRNGRPVKRRTHASTHFRSPAVFARLLDDFGGETRLECLVVENRTHLPPVRRDAGWLRARASSYAMSGKIEELIEAEVRQAMSTGTLPIEAARLLT